MTILDVAAEAGVSRQTVTRAMNDMNDISAPTRRRVLDAADRLGYRPSRFARNLVTRTKTNALGLVVSSFRNPYYTDIAADLLSGAAERGWQLLMSADDGVGPDALDKLCAQVDVVVGHFHAPEAELREACGGLPVVNLETVSTLPGVHSVHVDLEPGIGEAVGALRERGARRFAMVDAGYSLQSLGAYEPTPRRQWFERAVGDQLAGVVVADEDTISGGAHAFAELLRRHPDADAVLMFNDLMALGAVQSAHVLGVDVPGRVRIIGVDGLAVGEAVNPPLTTISIDRQGIASKALDIAEILAEADFATVAPIHRTVGTQLLWRASAG
ncbi:LacI family DNA-binding transcriptional regulator [Promicromonospora sp. NPDC057138]|uniref:LacI family DNA-binding transcriptional regulator n=1 Tax=Promicromonospora sp. NPDC057138 TaxID=3346031 RepID=UPI00362A9898